MPWYACTSSPYARWSPRFARSTSSVSSSGRPTTAGPTPQAAGAFPRARGLCGAPPCVRLEALARPRDRPVVVPAEERLQDGREDAQERLVREDDPVPADVRLAVPRLERPDALAAQVALHPHLELPRRGPPPPPRPPV